MKKKLKEKMFILRSNIDLKADDISFLLLSSLYWDKDIKIEVEEV